MAFQIEFQKEFLNIKDILPCLISKYYSAYKKYESISTEYPIILLNNMNTPLARSNGNDLSKPWLISQHYKLDLYPKNSENYIYCKNYNIQNKFIEIKNRYAFWLHIIVETQDLFYNKETQLDEIYDRFLAFSDYTLYSPIRDLICDLGYKFTDNLYGKEKEFYLYFINSIIEMKIDWKIYDINPEDFIHYNYL